MNKRQTVVIAAGAVSMLGWGAVLPYQYAYAAQTRGWGALVAASSATLFSVGALVAAPIGGRWPTGSRPCGSPSSPSSSPPRPRSSCSSPATRAPSCSACSSSASG